MMGLLQKITENVTPNKDKSKNRNKDNKQSKKDLVRQPPVEKDPSKKTTQKPKPKPKPTKPKKAKSKKPKLVRADTKTIQSVHDILQNRFVKLFDTAKYNRNSYYKVLKLVTSDSLFRGIKTYHNVPMAKSVLNEVVGLGVVSRIAREHPDVTDIVYNGRDLWYETNDGKKKYGDQPGEDASILTDDYINQLVTKFSNNAENNSSVNPTTPIFNGMYKDMRISVCYGGNKGLTPIDYGSTFAVRVTKAKLPLNPGNFSSFAPMFMYTNVFAPIVRGDATIMISGQTGTAKTSLQKLIIGLIKQRERIIMIEDTPETHLEKIYPQKDIMDWITSKTSGTDIAKLVETSLRNDPNWTMVAEVRDGKAAYQMFQSVKTGHSLMTTLHAKDNKTVPSRFVGMIRESMDVAEGPLIDDFLDYMDIGVHLSVKNIGGHTFRYLDELSEFVPKDKKHPDGLNVLFRQGIENHHGVAYRRWRTFPASQKIINTIKRNYNINHFQMPYTQDTMKTKDGKIVPADHFEKVPLNNN